MKSHNEASKRFIIKFTFVNILSLSLSHSFCVTSITFILIQSHLPKIYMPFMCVNLKHTFSLIERSN